MMARSLSRLIGVLLFSALACSLDTSPDETGPAQARSRPLVLLVAPVNGSVYAEGAQVELYAVAQDAAGVARLEFRIDEGPLAGSPAAAPGSDGSLSARATWTAQGIQGHLVTVEAFRADGSSMGTADVAVTVVQPAGGSSAPPPSAAPAVQPTAIPTPTTAPATSLDQGILTGPLARANQDGVTIRQGPGTTYPSVGTLSQGQAVQIVGHSSDSAWWAIAFGGGTAWVFAQLVAVEGDLTGVPLVAAP